MCTVCMSIEWKCSQKFFNFLIKFFYLAVKIFLVLDPPFYKLKQNNFLNFLFSFSLSTLLGSLFFTLSGFIIFFNHFCCKNLMISTQNFWSCVSSSLNKILLKNILFFLVHLISKTYLFLMMKISLWSFLIFIILYLLFWHNSRSIGA